MALGLGVNRNGESQPNVGVTTEKYLVKRVSKKGRRVQ
jgi:hypothetical protein